MAKTKLFGIKCTEEWSEHLHALAKQLGLPNGQAVVSESVAMLAKAAGHEVVPRLPDGSAASHPWIAAKVRSDRVDFNRLND